MEYLIAALVVVAVGGFICQKFTFRKQPERYAYLTMTDPETGKQFDYVQDNTPRADDETD